MLEWRLRGSKSWVYGSTILPLLGAAQTPSERAVIYQLRFRLNQNDVFDNLETLIKTLRPKTFNIMSARDFHKPLGEIVQDLEGL